MLRKLVASMKKFVKDNPIASSRRNTLVQVQGQRVTVNTQEQTQRPSFPHPPVQCYNLTVIPQIAMHNLAPQVEERKSREHSRKLPQNQMKEVRTPMSKTTSSPKELSGSSHGSTLPETSTVCRDKLSLTFSTDANRSKRNRPYHSTRCDTTCCTEPYTSCRGMMKRINSSCECTTDNECT